MLSEEKIRMMIRLSEYEQGQGKTDLYRTGFYRGDFIRLQVLKTILGVTISMVMMLFLVAGYKLEYFMIHATELDFWYIGRTLFIFYVLFIILFSAITIVVQSKKYDESRKRTKIYYRTLTNLLDYYNEEKNEEELRV